MRMSEICVFGTTSDNTITHFLAITLQSNAIGAMPTTNNFSGEIERKMLMAYYILLTYLRLGIFYPLWIQTSWSLEHHMCYPS